MAVINHTLMLLQHVRHQAILHLSAGQRTWRLRQSTFLPITSPGVEKFQKRLQGVVSGKFVLKCLSKIPPQLKHILEVLCDLLLIMVALCPVISIFFRFFPRLISAVVD